MKLSYNSNNDKYRYSEKNSHDLIIIVQYFSVLMQSSCTLVLIKLKHRYIQILGRHLLTNLNKIQTTCLIRKMLTFRHSIMTIG